MENRYTTKMAPATKALLWINAIVFALEFILDHYGLGSWFKPLIFDRTNILPYQFITYQFLHGSIGHLYNNMAVLFFFGPACERWLGKTKFVLSYLTFGIIAVSAQMLLPGGGDTMVGASGSIFGVVALFTLVDKSYLYIKERKLLPMAVISFILIAMEVPHTFDKDKIGHFAHIAGAASGGAAYLVFRKRKPNI